MVCSGGLSGRAAVGGYDAAEEVSRPVCEAAPRQTLQALLAVRGEQGAASARSWMGHAMFRSKGLIGQTVFPRPVAGGVSVATRDAHGGHRMTLVYMKRHSFCDRLAPVWSRPFVSVTGRGALHVAYSIGSLCVRAEDSGGAEEASEDECNESEGSHGQVKGASQGRTKKEKKIRRTRRAL